ncbi:MAG: phosphatidylserine decarboxylase family protein [Bacteroidales bacterium]|nr:phosphatidylserine decarboxylase family protein [Bacteroidales bacterium]
MKIHREGYTSLFMTLLFIAGLSVIINILWPVQTTWHYIGYAVFTVIFIVVLQFFRSPHRKIPVNKDQVLCPADGKVVVIEKTRENEYFHDERIQLSIFMSPVNVHVNRYPAGGRVSYFKYHPGKYLVAWHPKSSVENERTTVVVDHPDHGKLLIRQIAGALARRIVCYSKEGEVVEQGSEMGFIKFGSRVDVFLPVNTEVNVKLGEAVRGGETILATFKNYL